MNLTSASRRDTGSGPATPGVERQSLNDRVLVKLREAILSGEFKPGDRLVEGRLAERFGVSRNPVREALKALGNEGLITIAPMRGAIVTRLSESEAADVVELRAALEGFSARLAARRLGTEAGESLARVLAAGEEAAARGDVAELGRLNNQFHGELATAGSNRVLADFMRTLRAKTHWLFEAVSRDRAVESWREHAAILRAVLERDEEMAALLASRHVTAVGRDLEAAGLSGPRPEDRLKP